jgi:RNA recognition motif-containing protein
MAVRLFVGNLSYEATEAELREHFGTIGQVTYCYLPTDRETGRPRGFAFVEFADDSHAHQAIDRLNNQSFRGRPLAVKEAQPRESRPPGGGGGGPRFGAGGPGGPPRPYGAGPGGPPRPYGGPPRDPFNAGPGGPPASRERNFGPDAPPKGKRKPTYNRKDQQGPRGPIRTKTDNRIYSAFGDDDDPGVPGEFDDFATSLDPDTPDEE